MSQAGPTAAPYPEFDFWEFAVCSRCHLPFTTVDGAPPQVPFWITECAHILCNNHLNADQSCIQCGTQNVQIASLHRKMDAPMSEWFRPVTQTIDTLAFTARFQIESLVSQLRHYKRKCDHQRASLERAKLEMQQYKQLRKKYEELKTYTQQMKEHYRGHSRNSEPSDVMSNGKRRMIDSSRSTHTNSSPRSAAAPAGIGPERLTLQPQPFTPRVTRHTESGPLRAFPRQGAAPDARPGSSRFVEQYAYDPPKHGQPAVLSSGIQHSISNPNLGNPTSLQERYKHQQPLEGGDGRQRHRSGNHSSSYSRNDLIPPNTTSSQLQMPPPPVPSSSSFTRSSSGELHSSRRSHPLPLRPSDSSESLQSNRFMPGSTSNASSSRPTSVTTSHMQTQRFAPPTPSMSVRPANTSSSGSRRHSGPDMQTPSTRRRSDEQRVPFVPQGR
ncbi:hypothetical protein BXZ70DRAFT_271511 [Cristinia sonorae]|uniref:RING-type domain-containing protein n=1 Tax=Cristinia sonorae TaxID=1940300 RepID=A0A8K0UX57_9AGAR|nr:hypothetical protein BXZ70DRAFT_271511 [Cristinia sonorae]